MPARSSQRAANVRYYAANRQAELSRVRRRQIETTEFLRRLREVPCKDCGGRFAGHQMDFDHRDPSTKAFNLLTGRALLKSRTQLLAEIAKCDIVCANCHRLRSGRQHRERLASRPSTARGARIAEQRERWRYHADILDQLRSVPCADCGRSYAQCAMDFDHRDPSQKVNGVTRMISNASLERILAEAAKCDIVCANCHRLRTFRRRIDGSA